MKQLSFLSILFLLASYAQVAEASISTYALDPTFVPHATGLLRTQESIDFLASAPKKSFTKATVPLPGKYSMRGNAGPVEDQGSCGSCWDFSLTSVLRGTLMMANHKDPGRLSFNYLLNCATEQQGCNGGDFPAAAHFISPKGAPAYGSDGAYTGTAESCQAETPIASATNYHLLGTDLGVNPTGATPSFKDVAYIVGVLHLPVSVDVGATMSWQFYMGGTYSGCDSEDPKDINHMVSIEGYDCETSVDASGNCVFDANGNLPAGVGTWLIRNSWGTSWGDQGYITTKATDAQGLRCNAVATDALYFDAAPATAEF